MSIENRMSSHQQNESMEELDYISTNSSDAPQKGIVTFSPCDPDNPYNWSQVRSDNAHMRTIYPNRK